MESTTTQCAALIDRGADDYMLETAILKVFATEHLWTIVNDTLQVYGGKGYFCDQPVERWMRAGTTVVDPATTWIDADVTLEPDTHLEPNVRFAAEQLPVAGSRFPGGELDHLACRAERFERLSRSRRQHVGWERQRSQRRQLHVQFLHGLGSGRSVSGASDRARADRFTQL